MHLPETMPKPEYIAPTLIRTKNFSGLLIHLGMFLYPLLRGQKTKVCYNHSEIRFGEYCSGAIAKGVKTRLWSEYTAGFKNKYFKHYDYPIELTDQQWSAGYQYLRNAEGTRYEFANFFYHAVKIFTGEWSGSKTTRQAYCLEHLIRFLNATGKYELDVFLNPYQFEEWADENLKQPTSL